MKHISILVLCLLLCHIGRAQTGRAFMTSPDGGMYAYKKSIILFMTQQMSMCFIK